MTQAHRHATLSGEIDDTNNGVHPLNLNIYILMEAAQSKHQHQRAPLLLLIMIPTIIIIHSNVCLVQTSFSLFLLSSIIILLNVFFNSSFLYVKSEYHNIIFPSV